MSRYLLGGAAALVVAFLSSSAYSQSPPPTQPGATAPLAEARPTATIEGCLVREDEVPGRKPNVAERAGVLEDYILTDATILKGSAGPAAQPRAGAPVGTTGSRLMYEVQGISDDRLETFVGKRVRIDGSFENTDRAQARPESGTPADDLPEIRGTAIREVAGACNPPKK
jgi:hypothetical protein